MQTFDQDQLIALRDRNEDWLMAQPGVIGTGIGLDDGGSVVLRIFTNGIQQATQQAIIERLANIPLAWQEGEIVAY